MRFFLRISSFIFLFAILIATLACGGSLARSKNSTTQPVIKLAAQPGTVASGTSTVLSWQASNTTSVSISGLGTFPATGSVTVTPTATTTYTATATGPGGTTQSSTVVSVTTSGPKPTIALSAQPSIVAPGATAVLRWTTTNATSVSIAGVGTFGATGSAKVTPTSTTTYTATATGPGGTATSNTTVTVSQNPPPTISFNAQPSTIPLGGTAVLSWTTTNATSVNIPGVGSFPPNGSTNVKPATTTNYTATAQGAGGTAPASTTVTVQGISFGHVILLMEENHSYSSVIGSSSMPYLNSLAQKYGLATQYYANTHPSIGNYFELTTGQIITNDDSFSGTVSADNVVRHLLTAGKSWKSYAEGLPNVGYIGGDVYPYAKHHNPFTYLTDVVNSQNQLQNLVPFTQLATDLSNNQLPQYSFIIPNMQNDGHDGSLNQADSWLQTNIAPLIASSTFQNDGLLVIVFDESFDSDTQHGGGQVAMLVISPLAKPAFKSTTFYQHQNTCQLLLQGLGLTSFPGSCQGAAQMNEFF
ncbi:MAG TPA: alkaline phosphatase family protein [Terriglobales bacterium]|nr:alkaline phosphatase family protein [Terriglobales bacterium]